ncbi:LSU ribosomal protein L23P [Trichormus variabilis ATCC 29413]|uniref:Large ribosomal subunit protein uL23 n=2 Tax=Anabaena variabilis TaxID=264691 RepID=RL23_TRIV2|nr:MULTISPECIES: 50S ribosomal protein L23 [Nostocaceae]Q3MFB9.1 RecName: Full=Large ribosomal subunit protein uL23; AltName: Full=50S ribosomal protein L23 [Trichormus variabilis ATCC 29413]ABA20317.1 LSU ribosomal protein L23P [Trichormus variabilis ATCC 29413]MBC1212706.1 50S ribosomal protein L23 [Trichormus variabilis ARAD]MBC1254532.1 50S ribosomal protein L23 [Trichormus variabilis V5]MBC1265807.1 50S ribosomal protein L23 [Trichormus variabilis FSR]MBC1300618.1 50S ribosomal protein L
MAKFDPRNLPDLVRRPILTEKATIMMEQDKYTFEVTPKATKPQIRAAIEDLFQVKVVKVNTALPPRRKKRVGKFIGFKPQYKKAIVTIAPGDVEKIRQVLFPEV